MGTHFRRHSRWAISVLAALLISSPAIAGYVSGHVVKVDSYFMPGSIDFGMDTTNGASADGYCSATNLFWYGFNSNVEHVKAVYALLLSAYLSGKNIVAVYDSTSPTAAQGGRGAGSCQITQVYVQ